jgi:predicted phosphohydrolase
MKRFAWLTDIHLNFLTPAGVERFWAEIAELDLAGLLIGGDIAEAHDLPSYLKQMDELVAIDVYFVLGNHDYYFGSISKVRDELRQLCERHPRLHYLTTSGVFELTKQIGLVGDDGWADGRLGDYERSVVSMYDYKLIEDLAGHGKRERWEVLKRLGDEAAAHIRQVLPEALDRFDQVLLLTHVPPLREACWHEGRISDDQWAPHFTCKAVGDALLEIMPNYPQRRLTVLCGHTHGAGEARPLENLVILTAGAQYGSPSVQRVFTFHD